MQNIRHHTQRLVYRIIKIMPAKIDIGKSYDLISDDWQKFRNSTKINKCIVDFCNDVTPNGKILDIGCGTGYPIAKYLVEQKFYVTGIDISQKMIDKAGNLHLENATFIKKDILNFTSDALYDGVIAFDSIWHIAKERQPDVYKKIASLMKRGAYFLFTHGNHDGETIGTMFNREFYYSALNIDKLKSILAKSGLEVITLIENYKEQSTGERDLLVIAKKNLTLYQATKNRLTANYLNVTIIKNSNEVK